MVWICVCSYYHSSVDVTFRAAYYLTYLWLICIRLSSNAEIANRVAAEVVTKPEEVTLEELFTYIKQETSKVQYFYFFTFVCICLGTNEVYFNFHDEGRLV